MFKHKFVGLVPHKLPVSYTHLDVYKRQGGFGASFNTGGGFLDASLLKDKLKNDYLGIGASATFDKNGINIYQTTNVSLNLAYSKGFGRNVKHSLALGFGGEMKLGSLNLSNCLLYTSRCV